MKNKDLHSYIRELYFWHPERKEQQQMAERIKAGLELYSPDTKFWYYPEDAHAAKIMFTTGEITLDYLIQHVFPRISVIHSLEPCYWDRTGREELEHYVQFGDTKCHVILYTWERLV
jgi:hypothetical protein